MYEQSVRCSPEGIDVRYGVPGPEQTRTRPSPIDHETDCGEAVAVVLIPPAVAVVVKLCQLAGSTQSHVGRFTTLKAEGSSWITGEGSDNELAAWAAKALGLTPGPPLLVGAAEIHRTEPVGIVAG